MADESVQDRRYEINFLFGSVLYIAVGIVVFFGLLNAIHFTLRTAHADYTVNPESQTRAGNSRPGVLMTWIRRHLILPALFGHHHVRAAGWCVFPTRGQTILIIFYLGLNISLLMVHHPVTMTIKSFADRAGHLAIANMPIFFLFAGRNNMLIWVTGWQYKDFQVFHKWIARAAFALVVMHGVGYGHKAAKKAEAGPRRQFDGRVWWNGIAAVAVMGVLVLFSVYPLRKRAYELFLITHLAGAALFLMFLCQHVAPSSHPYKAYIWACVGIWSVDRFLRLLRLIAFNLRGRHTAHAKLISGTSTLRVTVYPGIKDIGFVPSAHYFLYIPDRLAFWESHPFTAASWRPAPPEAPLKVQQALKRIRQDSGTSTDEKGPIRVTTSPPTPTRIRPKLTFLITARKGMTGNLLTRIQNSGQHTIEIPCLLEGPYGTLRPIHAFPTILLVAGGVGISTALPYLQEHLLSRTPALRFTLIWTVREVELAVNVLHRVRGLGGSSGVSIKVYITGGEPGKDEGRVFPQGVRVRYRRPKIVEQVVKAAQERERRTAMAVVACGSGAVVDAARRGAVEALKTAAGRDGRGEVVYWEEAQGW